MKEKKSHTVTLRLTSFLPTFIPPLLDFFADQTGKSSHWWTRLIQESQSNAVKLKTSLPSLFDVF